MAEDKGEQRKHSKWTGEEDSHLRSLVSEFGDKHWGRIALSMPNRSSIQCSRHWNRVLMRGLIKGKWSAEEDQAIIQWVAERGNIDWTKCAKLVPGRTGKHCNKRWSNYLNPTLKKDGWSAEEDQVLLTEYQKVGPKWVHIAHMIPGRCENSVKNRFYAMKKEKEEKSEGIGINATITSSAVTVKKDVGDMMRRLICKISTAEALLGDARSLVDRGARLPAAFK